MAREDLIPFDQLSPERQKEMRHNAGVASGKARRNKKMLKDCLEILLERKMDVGSGKKMTGAEALSISLFQKALEEGDTAKAAKAFEVIRDTSGQKPVDKIVFAEVDQAVIDEVEQMMNDDTE